MQTSTPSPHPEACVIGREVALFGENLYLGEK